MGHPGDSTFVCMSSTSPTRDTDSWEFYQTHLRSDISCHHSDQVFPTWNAPNQSFPTHLSKRRVPIQTCVPVPLRQRAAPQYCDVQGEQKKSQEQQQFRRQPHHPPDATALGSLRCGRSVDSASSRCRDSNLRIRRGRGAATPLGSHFGDQKCNNEGKMIGVERTRIISFIVLQISC